MRLLLVAALLVAATLAAVAIHRLLAVPSAGTPVPPVPIQAPTIAPSVIHYSS